MQTYKPRVTVPLLFSCLATLQVAAPTAADQELSQTAVVGTAGDDVIVNVLPADADAVISTSLSEAVKTTATGIDSLDGDDQVVNSGNVSANSGSTADVIQALQATVTQAEATGVTGGLDEDSINNAADINVTATAQASTLNASLPIVGDDGVDVSTTARARTTGVTGDVDDDVIGNAGLVDLMAISEATSVGVSLTVDGILPGGGSPAVLSNARATADAQGTGIAGGMGDDVLNNASIILVNLDASATTVDAGVLLSVTNNGNVSGIALSDISAIATTAVTGISGGAGADALTSDGHIALYADSSATAVGVSLLIAGTAQGDASGAVLSDTSATADATARGIDGGDADDVIANLAYILLDTGAVATAVDVGTMVGITIGDGGMVTDTVLSDARTTAHATGTGIAGGTGDDVISNGGELVQLLATSTATGVTVSLDVAGTVISQEDAAGGATGAALSTAAVEALATVTGIDAGSGVDIIDNSGDLAQLQAEATATGVAASLNVTAGVGFKGDIDADISGAAVSDASVTAGATVTGIDGGTGDDAIDNAGGLGQLLAGSTATGVAASVDIAGILAFKGDPTGTVAGTALSDTSVHSSALVTGISGGDGTDSLHNTGDSTSLRADADATGVAAGVSITSGITFKGDADLDIEGAAISSAMTTANAAVTGIAGGAGRDTIYNEGILTGLVADSGATGVAASLNFTSSLNIKGNSDVDVSGESVSDTRVIAGASAKAIDAGLDNDVIENAGILGVLASAQATAVAASLDVTSALTFKGFTSAEVSGEAASKSGASAGAAAIGIDGGEGDDLVTNTALIDAVAFADAVGVAATLDVTGNVAIKGLATGDVAGIALSDSSATATAKAAGIIGGAGKDNIINSGLISLMQGSEENDAQATAVAASLSIAGTVGVDAAAEGTALANAGARADALAVGIDGGADDDVITNQGAIVSDVDAEATGVAAALGIQIVANGDASGAALSDATATATATAVGIDGGTGADSIDNAGDMDLLAAADATGVAVSLDIAASGRGSTAGEAMTDATATALAFVTGIAGGDGDDTLVNTGNITMMDGGAGNETDASATAVGVSVALSGTATGIAEGGAVSEAGALGRASATGLAGGAGADNLTNAGKITSRVDAETDATSASVSLSFASTGSAGGVAVADTGATAIAESRGIDGGADDDVILNTGGIDLETRADAEGLSLAIALSGSMQGVADGAALTEASTLAFADAVGIATGSGSNSAENTGIVSVFSQARAESTSISIEFSVAPVSFGASLADARSLASALATGIAGGDGADSIANSQPPVAPAAGITAEANAYSEGTSVAFSLKGLAMGETTNTARAVATGIDSGDGADTVANGAMLTAESHSTAEGLSVSIALAGEAAGNADTLAESASTGIATGAGADTLENTAPVLVTAAATAESDAVSVAFAGVTDANASTTARAIATGLSSGSEDDHIVNSSTITVMAGDPRAVPGIDPDCSLFPCGATARAGSVSLTLLGDSAGNASSTAEASATGIDGGTGNDIIENAGAMTVTALGLGKAGGFTLQLFGDADSDAATSLFAAVLGIDGGAGDDQITNTSTIETIGEARGSSRSYTVQLIGEAGADATVRTTAQTSGISGGAGNDRVENLDTVLATASALGETKGVAVNLVGEANARGDVSTTATAAGIDGGSDNDTIINSGTVRATATSLADVETESFTVAGVTSSEGLITSTTQTAGILGGDGADMIGNHGSIYADSQTTARSVSSSISIFGGTSTAAGIKGTTTAVGISGSDILFGFAGSPTGAGDIIENYALIDARATSVASTSGDAFTLGGGAAASAFITAASHATGIEGSLDADTIRNSGSIIVRTTSTTTTDENSSVGLGGDASAGAEITAETTAHGIASGGGGDIIFNAGSLDVAAASLGISIANSDAGTFFGDADGTASGETTATGFGLDLGAGDHYLLNTGDVTVNTSAHMQAVGKADGADFDAGDGIAQSSATARADGFGVHADSGNTVIENAGSISVTATTIAETCKPDSVGCTKGDGDGAGGDGYGAATATSGDDAPLAAAVWLGDGNHNVTNSGSLNVLLEATAYARAEADGDTVGASATVDGLSEMDAAVYGIHTGAGTDSVHNSGDMTVEGIVNAGMYANTNPSAWSDGFGTTNGTIHSAVDGYGITLGGDMVAVFNDGAITVIARTNPAATPASREVFVKADGDAQDATTRATLDTAARAGGLLGGNGENTLHNAGDVIVLAHANTAPNIIATSDTGGEADVASTSTVAATADGMLGGGLLDRLTNEGFLEVRAEADIDAWVRAGTGSTAADADAVNTVDMTASASGMQAGDVENVLTNTGDINVAADATANLTSTASTNLTDSDADSTANATLTAMAEGLASGNGQDSIFSSGSITVTASADTDVTTSSNGGDSAHGNTTANGTSTAVAYGIHTGDGTTTVINTGPLTVIASAWADTDSYSDDDGGIGDWEAARSTSNATASATGIETGAGNDVIENTISITVHGNASAVADADTEDEDSESATAVAQATGYGIRAGGGDDVIWNSGTVDVSVVADALAYARGTAITMNTVAVGIEAGDGNDVIWNSGAILTSATKGAGATVTGIGISAGAGNDSVFLAGDALVDGVTLLGTGDDLLAFSEQAVLTGLVDAGEGIDTARVDDRGHFFVPQFLQTEHYQVDQGTLESGSGMTIPMSGGFRAEIYNPDTGEVGYGRLLVDGVASLAGTAEVIARPRLFTDGEAFPLLTAEQFNAAFPVFDTVVLPQDSALVSFDYDYRLGVSGSDIFEVSTAVAPFSTVASNPLQLAIAGYLDRIAPTANGDLAEVLGTFQLLPASADFDTAFASLSPDSHDNYTVASHHGAALYHEVLGRRMHEKRIRGLSGSSAGQAALADRPLMLAYNDSGDPGGSYHAGETIAVPGWWRDLWGTAFGEWGDQDGEDGYTGFDYEVYGIALGLDRQLNQRLLLGASAAYSHTDIDQEKGRGDGDIKGVTGSVYGSYTADKTYVDGALSYGRNDYDSQRKIRIGALEREADSDHDGDVVAASLAIGYLSVRDDAVLEPYGRLQYVRVDEESFTETGAGSVNQKIEGRNTESLTSEVGVRLTNSFEKKHGRLNTEASIAWLHDFDIDDRTLTTSYTGSPTSAFTVDGQNVDNDGVRLGLGVSFENRSGFSSSLNYRGEFRDNFSAHGIMGQISFRF